MPTSIELAVLGPFRARVDGEDLTHVLSRTQRTLLALLAAAWRPVDKGALGHAAGFAASSVDPQLSRLRVLLRASRRLHRSRHPTAGTVDLDPAVVATDVGRYRALLEGGTAAFDRGDDEAALALLLDADDLWRGEVLAGVAPVEDATGLALVTPLVDGLHAARRRGRELAARCWLAGAAFDPARPMLTPADQRRQWLGMDRLLAWARSLRDSEVVWSAAALDALARDGVAAARAVASEWRLAASVERDAAGSARFGELTRLIGGGGPTALHIPAEIADLLRRAEDDHLAGRWDAAERLYVTAADRARVDGNLVAEAEAALAMARLTWDPGRFEGKLETRMARIVDALPDDETHLDRPDDPARSDDPVPPWLQLDVQPLRARLYACLAGGLYQDGAVGSDQAVARARQALELVSGLGDPLTAAEVLSRARKALIDVDGPQRQIERSGWILNQAGGSDYHRSLGHLATIVDSLLLDRVDQARRHTELYREIAVRTGSPFHGYHVAALDGLWALHDGRHAAVARATARAEALGAAFGGVTVLQVVEGQRLWSAIERDDHAEMRRLQPLLEVAIGLGQPIPVWELTAAYVASRLGDHDEAQERLAAVASATGDFGAVPRGALRIAALAMGTLVCADLTSSGSGAAVRSAARGLHAALVDHPALGVLIGWPTIYLGPKQHFVDLAAAVAAG